jgi:hypothetical protein
VRHHIRPTAAHRRFESPRDNKRNDKTKTSESTVSARGENHSGQAGSFGERGIFSSPILWTLIVLILSGLGIFRELL